MNVTASRSRRSRGSELAVRAGVTLGIFGLIALLLALMPYRWQWERVWGSGGSGGYILGGIWVTLGVSAIGMVVGIVLGFAGGICRLSRRPAIHQVGTVYVELIRGTPLLMQIYIAYFCFSSAISDALLQAGASRSFADWVEKPIVVGGIALGICAGAYIAEIVRAAVESVDKGQTEAALAQGMTRMQVLRLILLPQALRRMIPPMTGELVTLVKDSSLLSMIGVAELTKRSKQAGSDTGLFFETLLPIALLYLAINFPLSRISRRLEQKLA